MEGVTPVNFALMTYIPGTGQRELYHLISDFIRGVDAMACEYLGTTPCLARIPRNLGQLASLYENYSNLFQSLHALQSGRPDLALEFIGHDLDCGSRLLAPDFEAWRQTS